MKKIISILAFILLALNAKPQAVSICTVEITRPANTSSYTALDAISNSTTVPVMISFTNALLTPGRSGYIRNALAITTQSSNVSAYRLHLFSYTVTPINDNGPYTSLYVNVGKKIGTIDFSAFTTEGVGSTSSQSINTSVNLGFKLPSGSTTIYGILETITGFTPDASQKFYIQLNIDQN